MLAAMRSEWIKLRSVRANVVLASLGLAIPILISLLTSSVGDYGFSDGADVFTATVLVPSYLCVFLSGVIGVLGIGQEYRHNTIRVTFTCEARRSRVLAAKLITSTLVGLAMGLVAQLACYAIAAPILSSRDVRFGFGNPGENLTAFVGQIVLCGLFTVAGFGLGAILRQPSGAIPALLLWPLIGEGIVLNLVFFLAGWDDGAKWMPFSAGLSLGVSGDRGETLSRLGAGLYFGVVVAVIVGIGWWLVERRDA